MIGWAGPRGVVTLAAAFLIPVERTGAGDPGPGGDGGDGRHAAVAGADAAGVGPGVEAARTRRPRPTPCRPRPCCRPRPSPGWRALDRVVRADGRPRDRGTGTRPDPGATGGDVGGAGPRPTPPRRRQELYRRLRLQSLQAERDEVLEIRSSGTIDHDVVEQVLASYDVEESILTIATQRADQLTEEQPVATPATPAGLCDTSGTGAGRHRAGRVQDLPGLRPRGNADGAPADLPDLRQRRLLQLLGGASRRAAWPHELPPGDPELRAG